MTQISIENPTELGLPTQPSDSNKVQEIETALEQLMEKIINISNPQEKLNITAELIKIGDDLNKPDSLPSTSLYKLYCLCLDLVTVS